MQDKKLESSIKISNNILFLLVGMIIGLLFAVIVKEEARPQFIHIGEDVQSRAGDLLIQYQKGDTLFIAYPEDNKTISNKLFVIKD